MAYIDAVQAMLNFAWGTTWKDKSGAISKQFPPPKEMPELVMFDQARCTYTGEVDWYGPFQTAIPGTGIGGSLVASRKKCQERCKADVQCEAISYSSTTRRGSSNCFIYYKTTDTGSRYKKFQIWKVGQRWKDACGGSQMFNKKVPKYSVHEYVKWRMFVNAPVPKPSAGRRLFDGDRTVPLVIPLVMV